MNFQLLTFKLYFFWKKVQANGLDRKKGPNNYLVILDFENELLLTLSHLT